MMDIMRIGGGSVLGPRSSAQPGERCLHTTARGFGEVLEKSPNPFCFCGVAFL